MLYSLRGDLKGGLLYEKRVNNERRGRRFHYQTQCRGEGHIDMSCRCHSQFSPYLPVSIYLSIYLSIHLSIYLSIYLFFYLSTVSIYLSLTCPQKPTIYLSLSQFINMPVSLSFLSLSFSTENLIILFRPNVNHSIYTIRPKMIF